MSLFPQGSNQGMNSFSASKPKETNNIEKEKDAAKLSSLEEVPFKKTEEKSVVSEQENKKTKEAIEPQESAPDVPLLKKKDFDKQKTESIPVKNALKDDKKESSKEDEKELLPQNPNFKTSVKISGLNSDHAVVFEGKNKKQEESVTNHNVGEKHSAEENSDYENLSQTEKTELDDLTEDYFEKLPNDINPDGGIALNDLLALSIDKDASDIHFSADSRIGLRIFGKIHFIDNIDVLTNKQTRNLVFALVTNPLQRKKIYEDKELDASYEHVNGVNFRVNIFFKRGRLAAVLRKIASSAMTMEQLGLPDSVGDLLQKKQGLLLVTGPTGSGKSTSMQSMLEYINTNRVEHILTIEDPIEYIFKNKKSIFSQREVGNDTHSFPSALRASLREDPDVVMIGEMRDVETIQAAIKLSETGHLVISTLHTSSAPQTIARLVSYFPSQDHDQIRSRLADSLLGVLSQRLIPRADREGRVALYELLIVNSAIRNIIRTGEMTQIHNAMLSGREIGMILMHEYAAELEEQGIVHEKDFIQFFREE
jgi:twitching motility protein PilT